MPADQVVTFPIKLPEGITNETGVTEASVDIRFPDLGFKELSVQNIQITNVPEGMEAVLITQNLPVQVRGPKDVVEGITEEDVTVTVDLTDEQIGTATVKADVKLSANGAGTVGTYNVTVTLKKKR